MVRKDLGEVVTVNSKNVSIPKFERFVVRSIETHNELKNRLRMLVGSVITEAEKKDFLFQIDKFINGNLLTLRINRILLDDEGKEMLDYMLSSVVQIKNKVSYASESRPMYKLRRNPSLEFVGKLNEKKSDASKFESDIGL